MNIKIKDFIKREKEAIRKENIKILNLKQQISEYETVIDVVSRVDTQRAIYLYREKIDKCWDKINTYLDNIKNHESRIATMKKVDGIIAKGLKKSA